MNGLFERLVIALEAIAAQSSAAPDTAAPVTTEAAKPARTRKATTAAAPAEAPKTTPDPPAAAAFPYERLKKAIIDLASLGKEGKDAAIALLAKRGVKKASDAPDAEWGSMFDDAVAKLTELTKDPADDDAGFA